MTPRAIHRRKRTFEATGRWSGGDPFTSATVVRADFKFADGTTATFTATLIDPEPGEEFRDFHFLLPYASSSVWPIGNATMDVVRTDSDFFGPGLHLIQAADSQIQLRIDE